MIIAQMAQIVLILYVMVLVVEPVRLVLAGLVQGHHLMTVPVELLVAVDGIYKLGQKVQPPLRPAITSKISLRTDAKALAIAKTLTPPIVVYSQTISPSIHVGHALILMLQIVMVTH